MGKPYTLLKVEDGVEHRQYENGDVRDQNGRLIVRPERIKDAEITQENALAMRQRRKDKMLEAVERGVMKATQADNPYEAVSHIISKRAKVAMTDEGRAGNDAAKLVLEALDAWQDKKNVKEEVQRHVYEIDPDTMALIEEMTRNRHVRPESTEVTE